MINIPSQLAPALHKTLFEEINWAVEDGEPFLFDYYLLLASCYEEEEEQEENLLVSISNKRKSRKICFLRPEEEFYVKVIFNRKM